MEFDDSKIVGLTDDTPVIIQGTDDWRTWIDVGHCTAGEFRRRAFQTVRHTAGAFARLRAIAPTQK